MADRGKVLAVNMGNDCPMAQPKARQLRVDRICDIFANLESGARRISLYAFFSVVVFFSSKNILSVTIRTLL